MDSTTRERFEYPRFAFFAILITFNFSFFRNITLKQLIGMSKGKFFRRYIQTFYEVYRNTDPNELPESKPTNQIDDIVFQCVLNDDTLKDYESRIMSGYTKKAIYNEMSDQLDYLYRFAREYRLRIWPSFSPRELHKRVGALCLNPVGGRDENIVYLDLYEWGTCSEAIEKHLKNAREQGARKARANKQRLELNTNIKIGHMYVVIFTPDTYAECYRVSEFPAEAQTETDSELDSDSVSNFD